MSGRIARLGLLVALLALGAPGCVTSVTEVELEKELEQTAAALPKLGRSRVVPIYAETRLVARALLFEAKADPESQLSLQVGRRLKAAAGRRMSVVVGGPYAGLSDQVLENAFLMNRDEGLGGVRVLLVSDSKPSPELARAAGQARARLYHRPPR